MSPLTDTQKQLVENYLYIVHWTVKSLAKRKNGFGQFVRKNRNDIIQGSYLKLIEVIQSPTYNHKRNSLKSYIYTSIRNHILCEYQTSYRKNNQIKTVNYSDITAEKEPTYKVNNSELQELMNKLSKTNRIILELYFWEGKSLEEIAEEELGVAKQRVQQRLKCILRYLRKEGKDAYALQT